MGDPISSVGTPTLLIEIERAYCQPQQRAAQPLPDHPNPDTCAGSNFREAWIFGG